MVGLYDSEEHFRTAIENSGKVGLLNDRSRLVGYRNEGHCERKTWCLPTSSPAPVVIVFQDTNNTGKLTKNWLGKPTECYGFSNNSEGFCGRLTSKIRAF